MRETAELAIWKHLVDDERGRSLLQSAERCNARDVTELTQLRKLASAQTVRAAVELCEVRRKAIAKFPQPIAEIIIADRAGMEMATSKIVADYKAKRMASVMEPNTTVIHDLCSGIGADAMSFAARGFTTIAVENNPLRAWMTKRNADCRVIADDVTKYDFDTGISAGKTILFHLDPSRRNEEKSGNSGRRVWQLTDYQPGAEFIHSMIAQKKYCGAVKLGPGIDIDEIMPAENNTHSCEIEFISEGASHRLTQAIAWTGALATSKRRATHLPTGETLCGNADWDRPPIADKIASFVFTIDPAVERTQLLSELSTQANLPFIHPKLGLLTGDAVIINPWVIAAFQVDAIVPYHERRIRKWLRENNAGIVTIKTRDKIVNTDQLQKAWRGKGETAFTVFVLRFDSTVRALITRRISDTPPR